jgi:hypothetical protein
MNVNETNENNKVKSRRDPVQSDMTNTRPFLPKDTGRLIHLEMLARSPNYHIPLTLLPIRPGPPLPPPPSTRNVNPSTTSEAHHLSLALPTSSVSTARLSDNSHVENRTDREVAHRPK